MDTSNLDLSFIDDSNLRAVLKEYCQQVQLAVDGKSYLGVIVGCGAVVEGLLTWALLKRKNEALKSGKAQKDKQGNLEPIRKWSLPCLIDVSAELGVLAQRRNRHRGH